MYIIPTDTWRRIVVRDAPRRYDDDIANLYRSFRSIGDFDNISCLETYTNDADDDGGAMTLSFNTWTDNDFTRRLAVELESCYLHNQVVSRCDKQYVTMFYDAADGDGRNEMRVSLSRKDNII
jgi:hypothetical protein